MRTRVQITGVAVAVMVVAMGCAKQTTQSSPPQTNVMPDSIAAQNDRWVAEITARIAGRENLPAEQVFNDIHLLKGQSATRVLAIMNQGYSRALGVSCAHCHDPAAWESDARAQKKEARGMIRMVTMINEGNRTIPEFADDPPVVNCVVCHRGARRPVNNLGGQGRGGARGGATSPGAQQTPPPRTID